jgi:DNA polymerase III epsilon subunit family exonuclease
VNGDIPQYSTDARIDECDFLVIDVETTGLSADAGDRICEIGIVKLHQGEIIDSYGTFINPHRPLSSGAFAVNRISQEMLADAPSFGMIAHPLQEKIKDTVLVAYNAQFDLSFLRNEFLLAGFPPIRNRLVDALSLARQLLPGLNKYSQEYVSGVTGVTSRVKHRALEDAKTTAVLFQLFLTILKAHGCNTIKDIARNDLRKVIHTRRLTLIQHALKVKSNLWIKYLSPSNNRITDGIITPLAFVNEPPPAIGGSTLVALCHTTGEQRIFNIAHILDLRFIYPFPQ